MNSSTIKWLDEIPKIELHLHLEGALPRWTLWDLVEKYGPDPLVTDLEMLDHVFEYRNFHDFLRVWFWKSQYIRDYEDIEYVSAAVARDLARQNFVYVEAFFSPARYVAEGMSLSKTIEAVRSGLSRVPEIEIGLVVDLVRDFGARNAVRTVHELTELQSLGVFGIGLGGSEHLVSAAKFKKAFKEARNRGFHTTAHAGEVAGPESIWGVVNKLDVDRIGHATTAILDDRLLDVLGQRAIPLELCPGSNVKTGAVESIRSHPVRKYFDLGLPITINTDDPLMFGNSLAGEFRDLMENHGFSRIELRQLIINSVMASWLPSARKTALLANITSTPEWGSRQSDPAPS